MHGVLTEGRENTSVQGLSRSGVDSGLWEPTDSPGVSRNFLERQEARPESLGGLIKDKERLPFGLGGLSQEEGCALRVHQPAATTGWLYLAALLPTLSVLTKGIMGDSLGLGNENQKECPRGGTLLPRLWKGLRTLSNGTSSRDVAFALGHEGSGKANPRSYPGRAAQGWQGFALLQGGAPAPVFITP